MSPIIDLQRRLAESGRIRIGIQVPTGSGRKRPAKIEKFRLTSPNQAALVHVADKYGGDVKPWADAPVGNQWELFTESTTLDVLVPPEAMSYSVFYELWAKGGCKRRCDGNYQVPSDDPCVCDPEDRECKPHTRLSIMLADVPGSGLWRLDTQGWNAANEIAGAFELAQLISHATGRAIVPGRLRLDQREVKRPDPDNPPDGVITRKFAVPVLDFDVDLSAIARGDQAAIGAAPSGLTPIPDTDAPRSLSQELHDVETNTAKPARKNSAEPVRPTGVRPRARGTVHEDDEEGDRTEDLMAPTADQLKELDAVWSMLVEEDMPDVSRLWKARNIPPKKRLDKNQIERAIELVREVLNTVSDPASDENGEAVTGTPQIIKPDAVEPPKPTPAKMRRMFALLASDGCTDDEAQHDRVWKIVEHEGSFTELTRAEVNKVIDQLEADGADRF